MRRRELGRSGLFVSAEGLGCAGMSSGYGARDDEESVATLRRALELGITFFDTSHLYGDGHNERLVGQTLAPVRDGVVIASKFGFRAAADGSLSVDAHPDSIRGYCEESLRRIGSDWIDIYYTHRIDPRFPIEDTVGALADLVAEGKIRHIGLCEASSATLQRAAAVHPITALQSEWSLWTRDLEADVRATAQRLGIGIVAYCPLGRGFLTGTITTSTTLDPDDYRRTSPRFAEENIARNAAIVEGIAALAVEKGCTPAQVSLAWVMAQGDDVVPIPGTKRRTYLEQNVAAASIDLTDDDLRRLDAIAPAGITAGARYAQEARYADTPTRGVA